MPRTMTKPDPASAAADKPKRIRRTHIPRVALLIETTRSYGRNVLRGIGDYERSARAVALPPADRDAGPRRPAEGRMGRRRHHRPAATGPGVRAGADRVRACRWCRSPARPGPGGLPAVRANQEAVAELAINHFRERGFVRFAYCGDAREKIWPPTGRDLPQARRERRLHLRRLLGRLRARGPRAAHRPHGQVAAHAARSRWRCWPRDDLRTAKCSMPAVLRACTCRRRSRCSA